MASTSPIRIDDELYASAAAVAPLMSRSAAQQVTHWARIGRALEANGDVSARAIADVLAGEESFDTLGNEEQAVVSATWTERIATQLASLDFAADFEVAGETYSELDETGQIVTHVPTDH